MVRIGWWWIAMALILSLSKSRADPRLLNQPLSRIRALSFCSGAIHEPLCYLLPASRSAVLTERRATTSTIRTTHNSLSSSHTMLINSIPGKRRVSLPQSKSNSRRHFNFWLLFRGGAIQGQDPAFVDLSTDRKPIPPLLDEYEVSVCSVKGFRSYMEDEFVTATDFCGVFDGHGGTSVSRYLRQNLYGCFQAGLPRKGQSSGSVLPSMSSLNPDSLASMAPLPIDNDAEDTGKIVVPTVEEYVDAALSAYEAVDSMVQRISHWSYQGSTAIGVWLHDDRNGTRHIITTNVGDSRAVLYRRGGTIIELSRDHKPEDPYERARIKEAGGTVEWCGKVDREGRPVLGTGLYRLNGSLGLSRAIGDRSERPAVTAVPDVSIEPLSEEDEFVVMATDGLWDTMSTLDVVSFIHALLEEDDGELAADRDIVAAKLVEEALRRGSYDNVTVIILWLDRKFTPS